MAGNCSVTGAATPATSQDRCPRSWRAQPVPISSLPVRARRIVTPAGPCRQSNSRSFARTGSCFGGNRARRGRSLSRSRPPSDPASPMATTRWRAPTLSSERSSRRAIARTSMLSCRWCTGCAYALRALRLRRATRICLDKQVATPNWARHPLCRSDATRARCPLRLRSGTSVLRRACAGGHVATPALLALRTD